MNDEIDLHRGTSGRRFDLVAGYFRWQHRSRRASITAVTSLRTALWYTVLHIMADYSPNTRASRLTFSPSPQLAHSAISLHEYPIEQPRNTP